MTDTSTLTRDAFSRCAGQSFVLEARDATVALTLLEVRELDHGMRQGGAFSLLWQGPDTPALAQGTYQLAHDALGAHPMFLVPVARSQDGVQYESVFT